MTNRSTSADFVTAFATGWPEHQPDIMVLSLTTHRGVLDFAFNKRQDDQGDRGEARTAEDELSAINRPGSGILDRPRLRGR